MAEDKSRTIYIFLLLVLAALLVLFAQGALSGVLDLASSKPLVEINRMDLHNDVAGNFSKVSVKITNRDSVDHNFTINRYIDGTLRNSIDEIVVTSGKDFTYQVDVVPESVPRIVKFVVFMDESIEPYEEASFTVKP